MSEKQAKDDILELIQLVDRNKDVKDRPLFREVDIFIGSARILFGLLCIEVLIWFVYLLRQISFAEWIALTFALITILIAFLSLLMEVAEKEVVEIRFKRALEVLRENES